MSSFFIEGYLRRSSDHHIVYCFSKCYKFITYFSDLLIFTKSSTGDLANFVTRRRNTEFLNKSFLYCIQTRKKN